MKLKFENDRLYMLPEDDIEERFAQTLIRRVEDSNNMMGWYGDAEFDEKYTGAYIITWLPDKEPKAIPTP
ncbi:hypothetical protein KA005_32495 [bacterium]|nr:hypothetical protein [bacterium]